MYNPLPYLPNRFIKIIENLKKSKINSKIIFFTLGFLSTLWFLIRVIPKPSRATYPCMQATAPYMAGFVLWLTSIFSSSLFLVKFRRNLNKKRWTYAALFLSLFSLGILINITSSPTQDIFAKLDSHERVIWDKANRMIGIDGNMISEFDEVAIVKSDKELASEIDINDIELMVRQAIELAGGISNIVSNGDYVVLKPNLVALPPTPTPEYVQISGMATDWRVTKAVAKIVREINPDGKIYIIESSATNSTREVLNYYNYTADNFPEVNQIVALEDSCGGFEDYTDNNLQTVLLEDSIRLYPDEAKPNLSPEFYINKIYNNADVVISIPVLKNHKLTIITGGVKNVAIGTTPPNIYGMSETFFGKWTKIDHSWENINKWIHDYYLLKPVDFTVIDGLQGFDHGPTGDDELTMEEMQHNMRLIIAGKKALSVDAVCGNIMSLDPSFSNYMVYLDNETYDVGTIDSRFIRIKGVRIDEIREVFPHNTEIVNEAIYTDYTPPQMTASFPEINNNSITFEIESNSDLNKLELEVNGVLTDQICIGDFSTVTFEVDEILLPIDNVKLSGFDNFFNKTSIIYEHLGVNETTTTAKLQQNYPNPFTQSTNISFILIEPIYVRLYVSDVNGRLIQSIVNNNLPIGNHKYTWGSSASSGTYVLTLEVEGKKISKQMIKL